MNPAPPTSSEGVIVPVMRFLTIDQCPPEWRLQDLYMFCDGEVVFYVGQSHLAFERVWQHLRDGFKARSVVGRFIWCNWPRSLHFAVELLSSRAREFAFLNHEIGACEEWLIERHSPCFNAVLNAHPLPLPGCYAPPSAALPTRNLHRVIREAGYAVRAEERRSLRTDW